MARPTLRQLRNELAKLHPEVVQYLKLALPYGEMSHGITLPMQAETAQLYLAEALAPVFGANPAHDAPKFKLG